MEFKYTNRVGCRRPLAVRALGRANKPLIRTFYSDSSGSIYKQLKQQQQQTERVTRVFSGYSVCSLFVPYPQQYRLPTGTQSSRVETHSPTLHQPCKPRKREGEGSAQEGCQEPVGKEALETDQIVTNQVCKPWRSRHTSSIYTGRTLRGLLRVYGKEAKGRW